MTVLVQRTHAVEVVEDLVHSHNLVIQLVVAVGGGQERVAVCDEHVEEVHHLVVKDNDNSICFQGRKKKQHKEIVNWAAGGNRLSDAGVHSLNLAAEGPVCECVRACVSPGGPDERCCAWPAAWSH